METAKPFEAVATAQGKTLEITCKEGVSYKGDEATLRQLVSLLLDNAMKYSSPESTITLSLEEMGKRKQITVINHVETIGTHSPSLWFDRFYRQESSRNSKTGGHGIGLSVAKAIVTAHKGKITAAYKNGNQVIITVTL
ncbi:MAG: sensor histidine kinase [Clostridia bacterium]|nr:sensor histidine kinase [Clostridia bacterium]